MPKVDWNPIIRKAIAQANKMGHSMESFAKPSPESRNIRMASCATCHGCCWVSKGGEKPFSAGGRILAYQCGTKEARGVL